MDSLIAAAARALAAGDALGALKRVALRADPPALALRGIAMAQLGELARARELLRCAGRDFGAHEALARARCVVAEAEVALAQRDFGGSTPRMLAAAAAALEARADRANALHARLIAVRRLLLLGRIGEAAAALAGLGDAGARGLPPSLAAAVELAAAEVALRGLRTAAARASLDRAHVAAQAARVPALIAEVAEARAALDRTAARRLRANDDQPLRLAEVEALLASGALVVDACRRGLYAVPPRERPGGGPAPPRSLRSLPPEGAGPPWERPGGGPGATWLPLARRPVLFSLLRALAQAWPDDADRNALIARAFRTSRPDETHRARLRVEIGRLRALVAPLARIEATARGFACVPLIERDVALLLPPIESEEASLLALLADGAAWSTSALALALGASQRTVQRAMVDLEAAQRVRSIGRARAQRWLAPPLTGFTTILLLLASLPLA